jgi:hypothetical protein
MCDVDGTDPYTAATKLCDDDGIVRGGAMHHGTDYVCTGHAHFGGEHIRCTSPAHAPKVAWIAGTNQRVCGNCGHPVDAPLPFTVIPTGHTSGCRCEGCRPDLHPQAMAARTFVFNTAGAYNPPGRVC